MPSPSPHSENQSSANGAPCSRDVSASPNDEHAWWTSPKQLDMLTTPRHGASTQISPGDNGETTVITPHQPLSRSARYRRFVYTAITSNNTYSMIGNILITAHLPVGIYAQLACAGLAVWNEMREREDSELGTRVCPTTSLRDTAKRLLWSPGIYRYSLSAAFLANAVEQIASHSPGLSPAFLLLGAGNLCVAHDLNRQYFKRHQIGTSLRAAIARRPAAKSAFSLLTNGAVYWGIADMLVGLEGLHRSAISIVSAPPLFSVGVACAAVSVASVFVLAKRSQDSPLPFALNALTNYVFAAANLMCAPASYSISAAIALWGTGSAFLAIGKIRSGEKEYAA